MLFSVVILICAGFLLEIAANPLEKEWLLFKIRNSRKYTSMIEEYNRKEIFERNFEKIRSHNRDYDLGLESYKKRLNQFSDMTKEEAMKAACSCLHGAHIMQPLMSVSIRERPFDYESHVELPKHVDYKKQGAVTEVKSQGPCGSCWAFSVTGVLESHEYLRTKRLVRLSEQNLMDCAPFTNGCNGGLSDWAYDYVIKNKGIASAMTYPYRADDLENCSYNKSMKAASISSYVRLPSGNETILQATVALKGPVSVAIYASYDFMEYSDGVLYTPECRNKESNHAVLVVGYGTDNKTGEDYWLVKNSWGHRFGEKGYIRMARNRDNHCNIASTATYPVMDNSS